MPQTKPLLVVLLAITGFASGCASYRVSSDVKPPDVSEAPATTSVEIRRREEGPPSREFKILKPLKVTVKKLTVFHADPTSEQADAALRERARTIGADAVIEVVYDSGIGAWTWGYIDVSGVAIEYLPE